MPDLADPQQIIRPSGPTGEKSREFWLELKKLYDFVRAQNSQIAAAAPTTGTHARGDIVWNSAPSAGGKIGFVCTTAGTPGTWKAWGVIDA